MRYRSDIRQLGTVAVYLALLATMFFVPAARHPVTVAAACAFGWFTMLVNHNVMHLSVFDAAWANQAFRMVLSFCGLFPVSSVVPSHNLVHHTFGADGQPDWADASQVRFRWNLANLLHFPNVVGPITFDGVTRWGRVRGRAAFRKQYALESLFAFGLTGALLVYDTWTTLFCIVVPQLFSARSFLRINLIQHAGADTKSEWNHSRNFVGRLMNWFWLGGGYHTIHHNRASLHFSELAEAHRTEAARHIDPRLIEKSFTWYLVRTYLLTYSSAPATQVQESRSRSETAGAT